MAEKKATSKKSPTQKPTTKRPTVASLAKEIKELNARIEKLEKEKADKEIIYGAGVVTPSENIVANNDVDNDTVKGASDDNLSGEELTWWEKQKIAARKPVTSNQVVIIGLSFLVFLAAMIGIQWYEVNKNTNCVERTTMNTTKKICFEDATKEEVEAWDKYHNQENNYNNDTSQPVQIYPRDPGSDQPSDISPTAPTTNPKVQVPPVTPPTGK